MQPLASDLAPALRLRPATPADIDTLMRIDDEAALLFTQAGFQFSGPALDAFVEAERARWLRASECGLAELALDAHGEPIGFIALAFVDGLPYLDQLSVVRSQMRRGIGRRLLARAIDWAAARGELWLTTYAHVAWNGPMYARAGFVTVAEAQCGPGLRAILEEQRGALPDPEQRVAMVRR
jgi:GNAT superfamily N-acetyltransferase